MRVLSAMRSINLDGHMYTELVEGELHQVSYDEDEE